ncbi:hypothetical protein A2U01_0085990, partial [Trifolium medium]|nr:hypothetical protein [Trifolium medium]
MEFDGDAERLINKEKTPINHLLESTSQGLLGFIPYVKSLHDNGCQDAYPVDVAST